MPFPTFKSTKADKRYNDRFIYKKIVHQQTYVFIITRKKDTSGNNKN